jgi:hypothetical protein
MGILPDSLAIRLFYFRYFKKFPSLRHPKTFNEKIAWRKIYQRNPLFPVFADKIAVKAEIAKLVGSQHIIETLWVGDKPEDIPFDSLKPPFVIKVSHSSGGNIFVRSKHEIDKDQIAASLHKQLKFSHGHMLREWGYIDIPPRILVERMIEALGGDVPEDYKFFVYSGKVHFIQVDYDRFKGHKRNIYDRDYKLLDVQYMYPRMTEHFTIPPNLSEMLLIAERIGSIFDFSRVDLYSTSSGIKFGEITFYPEAGHGKFMPDSWDLRFGEPWKVG